MQISTDVTIIMFNNVILVQFIILQTKHTSSNEFALESITHLTIDWILEFNVMAILKNLFYNNVRR